MKKTNRTNGNGEKENDMTNLNWTTEENPFHGRTDMFAVKAFDRTEDHHFTVRETEDGTWFACASIWETKSSWGSWTFEGTREEAIEFCEDAAATAKVW